MTRAPPAGGSANAAASIAAVSRALKRTTTRTGRFASVPGVTGASLGSSREGCPAGALVTLMSSATRAEPSSERSVFVGVATKTSSRPGARPWEALARTAIDFPSTSSEPSSETERSARAASFSSPPG